MPKRKPLTTCLHMGCRTLVPSGYCVEHQPAPVDQRESAVKRGYNYQWQKERVKFLSDNPWCVECHRHKRRIPANEVDHIIPHKGDMKLFWDRENWQALCKSCHSSKTATEQGQRKY